MLTYNYAEPTTEKSNMAFMGEKDAKVEASKHLSTHIKESAKLLQRSFKIFEDPIQIQEERIEIKTFDNINGPEDVILYNGKRKREINVLGSSNLGIKKSVNETEVNSSSTHESLRETHKTKCLETIIINNNGILSSQDTDKIINEKNKGSIISSSVQADIKVDDGSSFHPTTKSSITSNIILLSQKYIDEFLTATGIDLTYRRKTVNCNCTYTCVCLGP